jgi:membrane complex biogenesis BtpA family protein
MKRPFIGVVHLLALPGAPLFRGRLDGVRNRALSDAFALAKGGVDAIIVENYGDAPFHAEGVEVHVATIMSVIAADIRARTKKPVGVNVLRNDARSAMAVAVAAGADFIRVNVHSGVMQTDQGVVSGKAASTLRYRRQLDSTVKIYADVLVKHAVGHEARIAQIARETKRRALADVLLVTGPETGEAPEPDRVRTVKNAVPEAPVYVASGVTPDNVGDFDAADGFIVGTWLKRGGVTANEVDPARVVRLRKVI